jgi:predicted naringenin-chalcone synthase
VRVAQQGCGSPTRPHNTKGGVHQGAAFCFAVPTPPPACTGAPNLTDPTVAHLNRIATAIPANDVHAAFLNFARATLTDPRARRLFDRMADRSGVAHRFSHLVPAAFDGPALDTTGFYRRGAFPTTARRMQAYEQQATELAVQAVEKLDPGPITHLIVASCTGFTAPGIDQRLAERLQLGGALKRTLVGFMGCYAAVPALRLAQQAVLADPTARVVVVMLELCTLHLQETQDIETVLSFLIFGDGAAAVLVTAEPEGFALHRFHAATIPGTQDHITWRIGDQGFDMHLSGKVPGAIAAALRLEADRNDEDGIMAGQDPASIALWAVHAGGRTVLDAVEQGLRLPTHALDTSRAVLHDVGNVSSATIGFVLERMLASDCDGPGMAIAFGPGLCAETFQFSRA